MKQDVAVSDQDKAKIAILRSLIGDMEARIVSVLGPYVGNPAELRMLPTHDTPYPRPDQEPAAPVFKTPKSDAKAVCWEYVDPPGVCRPC